MSEHKILIVDDEPKQREILSYILTKEGYTVFTAADAETALDLMNEELDMVITDLLLPGKNGIDFLEEALKRFPDMTIVIITGHGTIDTAVTSIKKGAFDYIQKPLNKETVLLTVKKGLERTGLLKERKLLYSQLKHKEAFGDFVGEHPLFKQAIGAIVKIADVDTNVLITGESGTGKDIAAQYIHKLSNRKDKPFIPVNCAAIPETLIESELFGFEKGAFTGAVARKKGIFESASGGTIFLDEISEISPMVQAKLLRLIQNKEILPLGSSSPIKIDVRIVAATNKNLEEEVRLGNFRQDLFYRLNVFTIRMPSLRERISDIPLLANHFLQKYKYLSKGEEKYFSKNAIKIMLDYPWYGNVRELESFIQKVIIMSDGVEISEDEVKQFLNYDNTHINSTPKSGKVNNENKSLEDIEKELIENALRETGGNITKAAKKLGLTFRTLQYRIGKYGIKK
ncbi:sigma-54-dependent transcriptional regulator [Calditerrivibrio nitroreducens]|uniref:Two component, sigma54 specific, transcriptional regulator, Fis family n=1 Tax=Calditerrivibrio nitroreducens (strain DSM 19672 / NBRC 101217 / Yu37-1) TaxID=768670 RepID=E4TJL0_CALNY|nr:sigma-54 dependent transcriptional regulator [Calditerrivibrio nitroreducens]ADR18172.1 two component, sigma54 specific, transcriptional regulator, Fis family [Calditerrivibrio nitroreducens DSM 19672]